MRRALLLLVLLGGCPCGAGSPQDLTPAVCCQADAETTCRAIPCFDGGAL